MSDISNGKKAIADLGKVIADIVGLVQGGKFSFAEVPQIFALLSDMSVCVSDAKLAFPEFQNLDAKGAGALAEASFEMVKSVVASIEGKKA